MAAAGAAGAGPSSGATAPAGRAGTADAAAPFAPSTDRAACRAEAQRILDLFRAAGAVAVETDILQPAARFLDLYGEEIRARAYVTSDPLRGELMLRPDFTLPVVERHMAGGAEPARYCYAGEIFRRQEQDSGRPSEYVQVGFELFARRDPAEADAEVFALIAEALKGGALQGLPLRPLTGDIGFLTAAVRGLDTSEARKAALLRHIWRPRRFRALLDRYAGRSPVPPARAALLAAAQPLQGAGPLLGLRSRAEIEARIEALRTDAAEPPLAAAQVAQLERLLAISCPAPQALARLRALAEGMPAIRAQVETMARRLDALATRGVPVGALAFEASHGRSAMEYYDGFVFSFLGPVEGVPPLASGGRYDALTRILGAGASIPAVGGIIRPDLALAARAAC